MVGLQPPGALSGGSDRGLRRAPPVSVTGSVPATYTWWARTTSRAIDQMETQFPCIYRAFGEGI